MFNPSSDRNEPLRSSGKLPDNLALIREEFLTEVAKRSAMSGEDSTTVDNEAIKLCSLAKDSFPLQRALDILHLSESDDTSLTINLQSIRVLFENCSTETYPLLTNRVVRAFGRGLNEFSEHSLEYNSVSDKVRKQFIDNAIKLLRCQASEVEFDLYVRLMIAEGRTERRRELILPVDLIGDIANDMQALVLSVPRYSIEVLEALCGASEVCLKNGRSAQFLVHNAIHSREKNDLLGPTYYGKLIENLGEVLAHSKNAWSFYTQASKLIHQGVSFEVFDLFTSLFTCFSSEVSERNGPAFLTLCKRLEDSPVSPFHIRRLVEYIHKE